MSSAERSKRHKARMIEKGFKQRPFWLSNDTISALDDIQNGQGREPKTKDDIVNESIKLNAALTPDEYRMIHDRLKKF